MVKFGLKRHMILLIRTCFDVAISSDFRRINKSLSIVRLSIECRFDMYKSPTFILKVDPSAAC